MEDTNKVPQDIADKSDEYIEKINFINDSHRHLITAAYEQGAMDERAKQTPNTDTVDQLAEKYVGWPSDKYDNEDWAKHDAYKAGYLQRDSEWYKQTQEKKKIITFADWLHYNQFVRYVQSKDGPVPYGINKDSTNNIWISTKIQYGAGAEYFTTEQLYQEWEKSVV